MSLFSSRLNSISGQADPLASQAEKRADRMQQDAADQASPRSLFGSRLNSIASPELDPLSRSRAIPSETDGQQLEYSASQFAEDAGRKATGSLVGGTLSMPAGAEAGIKGAIRRGITGETPPVAAGALLQKASDWLMDATGFMSYAEQAENREKAAVAFDRLISGVKIPGAEGMAEYGSRVQRDIESGISEAGKQRLAGSTPRGNLLKGELSFGDDPTVAGYALQAAGVLGSLAPTVATAVLTRSPTAAMAVGGSQAAGEAASTAREYVGNLSDEQLTEVSPYYSTLLKNGLSNEEARQIVTDKAAETGAMLQGMVAALGSRVTGKLLNGAYDDILRRVGGNRVGAASAGAAFGATEEGLQETAEGIASDVGIRSQITDKEIGTDSAANLVLGALGGAPVGAISGAKSTPESALDAYLKRAIDGARINPDSVDRQARAALDPNRDVALDPISDVRAADSELGDIAVRQTGTAVGIQQDSPEPNETKTLDQPLIQQAVVESASPVNPVDVALAKSEQQLLDEVATREANRAKALTAVPEDSFVSALTSMKQDLGLDDTENLNLGLVTTDTRLNRFKGALESAFGVKVHFVDFGEQLSTDTGKQLGAFSGYRSGDTILVSAKDVDLLDTTWHELTHVLETRHADVYQSLRDTVVPAMDATIRQTLIDNLNQRRRAEVGRDMSQKELDSELVAYVVGDLVRNPQTLGQMFDSFNDPNVAKTFRDVLADVIQKMLAVIKGPQYIKERARLVEAQKAVTSAFAEYQKRETQKRMSAPVQPATPAATSAAPAITAASMPPALAQKVAIANSPKPRRKNPFLTEDFDAAPAASVQKAAQTAPAAPVTAAEPQATVTEPADEADAYKRVGGQFNRDVQKRGKLASDAFNQALDQDPQGMIDEYMRRFGREVNTDQARELSPIYLENPAVYAAYVHEGSSRLSKMVFDYVLANASPNDIVRFTAGGGGSGKGFAVKQLNLRSDNVILYDGTLSKLETAVSLINKSVSAGLSTEVYYINSDAMDSLGRAMKRAERIGRTVPIEVLAEAHDGASKVARQLLTMFSNVPVRIVNNAQKGVVYGTVNDLPRYNVSDLKEKMYEELDRRVKEDGYPINLAVGFAPARYSGEADQEQPAKRDAGTVRAASRRGVAGAPQAVREQSDQPAAAPVAEPVANLLSPETIPADTNDRQTVSANRFRLGVQRAGRTVASTADLSADERQAIEREGAAKKVPRARLDELIQQAIETKRRFPVSDGWAPMFVRGVLVPEKKSPAEAELNWTPISYKFNVPDGIGRAPQKLNEPWADKVSEEFYKLVKGVYGRAVAGDRNANVILAHKNWYRNVTEVLRREFGGMGDLLADLLGATSPNTPVDTNWRFSIDILRRFVRGDFDAEMRDFAKYIENGGNANKYPAEKKIAQISGKLYGMNSTNAQLALLNAWRQIKPNQAPKARNFALNLIGQSDMATIDVWAARMLRRAANIAAGNGSLSRIPPPAEQGVTGDWNAKATAVTGEFGFGARVMDTVAQRLRAEGIDVTAPDLQAIAWFVEKELWASNGWTSAQGEGGSFEENIESQPMERYIAGWSIQRGEVTPEEGAASAAQARVMYALKRDSSVIAARVLQTKGLYGGTVEQSFDTEWTVEKGAHNPALAIAEISQIAKENEQYDIFVSKVLQPDENSANARPGVEIYFRDQRALDAAMPVLERFTSNGVDGFTMAVDPRAQGGNYIGVRLQFIPEISMRWDEQFRKDAVSEGFIERMLDEKTRQLDGIAAEVSMLDGVAFAKTYQYDTIVVGKENYDEYIDRAAAETDSRSGSAVWFGQSIRNAVERAVARLDRDQGQVVSGSLSDADGQKAEPETVGQFSRRDVELAANQDPRAPKLFGISENPAVLRAVGAPDQLLVIEPRTVVKVVNPQFTGRVTEEGGMRRNSAGFMVPTAPRISLTVDELRSVPKMIADPVAVIGSEGGTMTRRYGYKVVLDMVKDGNPVVAIVHPDVRYGNDKASEIASVYPVNEPNSLKEIDRELKSGSLLYFNKGKAVALAGKIAGKLPSLSKSNPEKAKNPGSVKDRSFTPLQNSNFARRVPTVGQRFTLPARTLREKYLENLFENRMSRVEDVQQAVEQQGGTLDVRDAQGNVIGSTDISTASQRMRGAVRGRLDRFKKEVEIPLIEKAAKLGVNLDEVAQYLYAMHAPERNAVIQQRNPAQFSTDGGSGMTNAEAAQIVASFRARRDFAKIAQIAKEFQSITQMTQNLLLTEGLIEPQVIAQWRNDNPNYVPLRGFENFDESTGKSLGVGSPGRLDPRNPFVKVAKGRETRAGQILENILKDYSDAVVLAEKNKVYRLLLQFVRDNPDAGLWEINAPKVSRSYYKGGMTPLGYAQGTVRVAFEVNENPNETIAVRVQGKPVFIRVKDAGMLEDLQMAGAVGSGDQAKLYFRVWSGAMQTLAKLRTTLSPAFVFIDAIRNTETGGFFNLVKYGPKTAAKAYARMFKAARVAWKAERDGTWQGNTDTITIREPGQAPRTITLKEAYDMYRADGGKIGYLDIKEIEDIQQDIQQRFRAAQVAGSLDPRTYGTQMLDVVNKVEDLMLDAAGSIETAMRFATYMARLEAGANRQDATDAAKNVTVNFDRKGKWTPHLGLLYMFANANIQGTRATYNLVFKSGKAGAILGGSLVALGYAIAQLGAGASGDDDEPYWDKKLYKQAKLKNLVFFTAEGDTVTIPMAYGAGFFVNLGYAMSDLQRGVPLAKVGAFMRDSFFTHFSPFGSMDNPATFAAPTLLDPVLVNATNLTEQGIPLMPDSVFDGSKPDSEKFWASTRGTMFQQLSRAINEATGGTPAYSGVVDVSPETLRYWFAFATGGAGGFVRDSAETIFLTSEIGLDSAVDKNKIPIVRSFVQQNTGKQNQTEFFENAKAATAALQQWKDLYGTEYAQKDSVRARLNEQKKLAALGSSVDRYKKALSALRAREVEIVDKRTAGVYSASEAEDRLSRVAEQKDDLYVRFNKAFYMASPDTPE